jgi:molybdopterin-binding protein
VLATGPAGDTLNRALLTLSKQRPGPVNLLRVTGLRQAGEHWEGELSGQRLHLPHGTYQPGGSVYVQLLPQEVMLSQEPAAGVSARNRLAGVVRELVQLPGRTFVAVDVGQFLWAQVTPEAAAELGLQPGRPVTCLIKTSSLVVMC